VQKALQNYLGESSVFIFLEFESRYAGSCEGDELGSKRMGGFP
jgi:hypothetical protein